MSSRCSSVLCLRPGSWSRLLLVAVCAAMLLGSGCTIFKEKPELSADENYRKGMEEFDDEDYEDAIPYFQKILENYPFSIHAVPAELKIGESYFKDEKYVEALVHLQGFQELHPTNEEIPYVMWMKAVSFDEQFSTIDRDVSTLENAKKELEELKTRFPTSPYAEQADERLQKVLNKLAEHDFYVARFYYRDARYQAALPRFQHILDQYSGEQVKDRALYYVGKCYYFTQDSELAKAAFQRLLEVYPDSPYVSHAKAFLSDLEKGRFAIISKYFRLKERLFWYFGYE
jgi:outer membrane protein assembly factor BamD